MYFPRQSVISTPFIIATSKALYKKTPPQTSQYFLSKSILSQCPNVKAQEMLNLKVFFLFTLNPTIYRVAQTSLKLQSTAYSVDFPYFSQIFVEGAFPAQNSHQN